MVVLGGGAVSYERGTPVAATDTHTVDLQPSTCEQGCAIAASGCLHIETLTIYKLSSRNFTTQNDLDQ